jgi:retron-type reverse transcriptase
MIKSSLTASELWKSFNWKKASKKLFRLQRRIYKSDVFGGSFPRKARAAVQVGNKRKARSLQKLILKSQAARLLAIRQVTQLNAGKKTAGIDGKASLNFEERHSDGNHNNWKRNNLVAIHETCHDYIHMSKAQA